MPCRDDYAYHLEEKKLKDKTDELTQNLCYLTASLNAEGLLGKYANSRITNWFRDHQETDEKRVRSKIYQYYIKKPARLNRINAVAERFINKALEVHPVSEWHKNWFRTLAQEEAEKVRQHLQIMK